MYFFKRGLKYLKSNGFKETLRRTAAAVLEKNPQKYNLWMKNCEDLTGRGKLSREPLISVIMPVYNPEIKWLERAVLSVKNQTYGNWELCIADDCSAKAGVKEYLKSIAEERIKVVFCEKNGGISAATNRAAELARGEYLALLDNDDELAPNALFKVAEAINRFGDADLIYSDEDKIDERGIRFEPFFKPDYCPDTLLSLNYISHLGVYKRSVFNAVGGLRSEFDGSQDYDLALRLGDITDRIFHIPCVLYHWRVVKGSTSADVFEKSYAYTAAKKAIEDTVKRRGYMAEVRGVKNSSFFQVCFKPRNDDFASIIIPMRDKAEVTERCLKSIFEKTDFKNYEVILADNGSEEAETFAFFERWEKREGLRIVKINIPFNFSKINNIAAKYAKGNILVFLNNDTEIISNDWLSLLAGEAGRESIGCVGAKLLYPNDTVQHCGIVLGGGGLAGHCGIGAHKNERGYFGRLGVPYNYSAVTAACLCVKRSVFDAVGGFEEDLAVAFNDVDFCLKAQRLGLNNICLPSVMLYHYESLSRGEENSPEKIKRFNREILYMKNKWGDLLLNDPCYNINLNLPLGLLFTPVPVKGTRRLAEPEKL